MSVPVTTVQVAISLWQITGQPLPNARVQFGLTKADVQTGSGLVLPAPIDLFVDANGTGVATLFANVDGLQGTQTSVAIYSATGQLQYSGYASIPAFNCNLHDVLNLTTPSVTDAQTAVNTARDWALRTGSDVPEGVAGDRSSKSWAQEDLTPSGQNRGGSSKDWAISSTLPDGVNPSAKTSAAAAAATALQTAADRVQTGADRVQTGQDVVSANAANAGAVSARLTAIAQASLASIYALSAASVAQQDLSGVTAAALHRSPNAVVGMCIDDPRTHSDGGAWTGKVDHLSWMNEPLQGAWLTNNDSRGLPTELDARCAVATTSAELSLSSGTPAANATIAADGTVTMLAGGPNSTTTINLSGAVSTTALYRVTATVSKVGGAGAFVRLGSLGATAVQCNAVGVFTFTMQGGGTNALLYTGPYAQGTDSATVKFSVKQITGSFAPSGSYYQSATDGKFYRVWKNLLKFSEDLTQPAWNKNSLTVTPGIADPNGGTSAFRLTANGNGASCYQSLPAANLQATISIMVRRVSGTGNVNIMSADGTTSTSITGALTGSWQRFTAPATNPNAGATLFCHTVVIGTVGDVVEVAFPQAQYGSAFDSYESKQADQTQTETFRGNVAHYGRTAWVAEASRVVGYSLDQPGRPMWMVFAKVGTLGASVMDSISAVGANFNSVAAREGALCVTGSNAASLPLLVIDFARDDLRLGYTTALSLLKRRIADRQTTGHGFIADGKGYAIVSNAVNAAAMTTMPDAPVDPVTGLQVPTIQVLTAGGMSVIQNDGTVVNSAAAGSFAGGSITPYGVFAFQTSNANFYFAAQPSKLGAAFALTTVNAGTAQMAANAATRGLMPNRRTVGRITSAGFEGVILNESNPTASLAFKIAPDHNVGLLCGDIRRCYLSDVSVGTVNAAELVTNGGFAADVSGWTPNPTGPTVLTWIAAGDARVTNAATSGFGYAYQTIATVAGQTYSLTGTCAPGSANGIYFRAGTTINGFDLVNSGAVGIGATVTVTFTAVGSTTYITMGCNTAAFSASSDISLISVKAAVLDRSYKASRLVPHGTLTKAQVGVGSQLVAYSGFSAANYLQEAAHSTDLDPGTGALRLSNWVNVPVAMQLAQNLAAKSNLFGAGSNWNTDGLTVADGSLTSGGHTYALLQQPAVSTGGNRIFSFGPTTIIGAQGNASFLVRRNGASTDRLRFTATNMVGSAAADYDPVTQTFASGGAGFTITVIDASTARVSVPGIKTANSSSSFANMLVVRASDGALFGGGTGGVYVAEYQYTVGTALLTYEDVPGSVTIRCHPAKEYNFSGGAYYTVGFGGDGFPMVELWDTVTKRTASANASATASIGTNYGTGTFIKLTGEYSTSGTLTLKINAQPITQTTGAPLLTLTNANALLTVGQSYALNAPFPGSIALGKIGMTVPSDDASRWTYEQEKEMFRDGAQVTLPDSGAVADLDYDHSQDKWKVVSAANESSFVGLVQISQAPVPAGSFTHVAHRSGIKLLSRSTTNPGVDITIPAKNALEEFNRRAEDARALARLAEPFDFVGGFTATTTTGSALLTSVASLSIPAAATVRGAQVSGTGIPVGTTILDIQGTTIQLSAVCTASASGVAVSFTDFILPIGYEAKQASASRQLQQEGATKDWTRRYDGFREAIRFPVGAAPGNAAWVQLYARRIPA